MWSTRADARVRSGTSQPEPGRVRRVRTALGDVDARGRARVQPVARKLERGPLAHLEPDDVAVEVAGVVDVVAEHEHVLDRGDRHVGRGSAPATAERPPRRCLPRNRYADWSSSGFSRSSLAIPENWIRPPSMM